MAVYRLGDMVRMRRKALGITQEELIQIYDGKEGTGRLVGAQGEKPSGQHLDKNGREKAEICSVQALHRIENGGVARAKILVFRRLMMKMGVLPERTYASILVTECRALRLKTEIHVHMNRGEYEEAERKLGELEKRMVPGYPRNVQYLKERRATLAYKKGELEAQAYLEALLEALRYTVPKLDEIAIEGWPFNENEFDLLFNISNAYHSMKEREKEWEFLLKLKENIERQYMDGAHYTVWHMCALAGLSQLMCNAKQHAKSMEYCKEGLEESRKYWILGNVPMLLYDIAWNQIVLIGERELSGACVSGQGRAESEKERAACRKQLVQAYYLSVAQGDTHESERIKRLYERNYPEAVRLL